jgi:hypothetical protein
VTGVYNPAQRAALAAVADQIATVSPAVPTILGPAIADVLRKQLPDLDDVTIGRVLIALTSEAKDIILQAPSPGDAWSYVIGAGLDLTQTEWKEGEQP